MISGLFGKALYGAQVIDPNEFDIPPNPHVLQLFNKLLESDGEFTHIDLLGSTDPRHIAYGHFTYENDDDEEYGGTVRYNSSFFARIDDNQMLFILGHELGHFDFQVNKANYEQQRLEMVCDFYSLITLMDMDYDGANINLFDAISVMKLFHDDEPAPGEVATHPRPSVRYKKLYDRLISIGYLPSQKNWNHPIHERHSL